MSVSVVADTTERDLNFLLRAQTVLGRVLSRVWAMCYGRPAESVRGAKNLNPFPASRF